MWLDQYSAGRTEDAGVSHAEMNPNVQLEGAGLWRDSPRKTTRHWDRAGNLIGEELGKGTS